MNRRISRITIQERADWSFYESTGITFDNMCFGRPVDQITPTATEFLEFNSGIFIEEVWLLRSVPIAEHVNAASVATMAAALNAIPAVCAAPSGFATMASLPQVHSVIGFGNR